MNGKTSDGGVTENCYLNCNECESRWGVRFSASPDRPWGPPTSCTTGTGSFPGVKCGRGVLMTTHPLLVPRSWKSRAIPLPTLWATTGPVTGSLYLFYFNEWKHIGWGYHWKYRKLVCSMLKTPPTKGGGVGRLLYIFIGDEALSPRTDFFKTYCEELTDSWTYQLQTVHWAQHGRVPKTR